MAKPPPPVQIERVLATATNAVQLILQTAVSRMPTTNKTKREKTKEPLC
jgi:hypothetical protein